MTLFLDDLGPVQETARRCIHCGFCNAVCPTSNVVSAFKESRTSRGRVIMIQSLVEKVGDLDPSSAKFKRLIDLCFSCRRCISVCPAGIPIPELMSRARYAYRNVAGPTSLTVGHRIFASYGLFDRLGSSLAPLSNYFLRRRPARILLQAATHIDSRAHLPQFHSESFGSWFKKQPIMQRGKKVVYFVDSYANYNDPSLGMKVLTILNHLGYQVLFPPQKESGMPAIEFGMLNKARSLARYNVSQLLSYARDGIPIVCSSPAASYLLREGYSTLLKGSDVSTVSRNVVDMTELLNREFEAGTLRFMDQPPLRVIYHYCCLSKALELGHATTRLLASAGIQCRVVEECCGGAGVWGTFKENYELSSEIAGKLRSRLEPNVEILTESETCRLQMEAHISPRVRFPIELLAQRVQGLEIGSASTHQRPEAVRWQA